MVGLLTAILGGPAEATPPWRLGRRLQRLLRLVRPYTLSDRLRLATLYGLAREVEADGVPGDIVECGVYRGGSAAVLAAALGQMTERRLWLFDTFEGLPAPSEEDGELAQSFEGMFAASVEILREVIGKVGFPWKQLKLRKGLFQDTLRQGLPERIALLHIDADWYESTLLTLRALYPRVSLGGIVVIDDFGYWEGARKAFFTFCREEGAEPLLERVGDTQAFWRKGAENNREHRDRFGYGIFRARS